MKPSKASLMEQAQQPHLLLHRRSFSNNSANFATSNGNNSNNNNNRSNESFSSSSSYAMPSSSLHRKRASFVWWCGVLVVFALLILVDCWWNQRIWSLQFGLRASLSKSSARVKNMARLPQRSMIAQGQQVLLDLVDCDAETLLNPEALVQATARLAETLDIGDGRHPVTAQIHVTALTQPRDDDDDESSSDSAEDDDDDDDDDFTPSTADGFGVVANWGDSHFTLHTWPTTRTALVNLLVADEDNTENLRQDVLPLLAEWLGGNLTRSTYSVIPRGTDVDVQENLAYSPAEIMTRHQFKLAVSEVQSPFQHVAIWDHFDIMGDDFDEKQTTRSLFLDGVMQSSIEDEFLYHETLVQPAFIASAQPPKRVLIVGGGEGGTLRETLKWKSVEKAVMVDLDAQVVQSSRRHLGSYNNCSGFGTPSCFDDPRVELFTTDFFKWFDEHIGDDICAKRHEKEKLLFDIIILDLLDTEELPEGQAWAEYLYSKLFFERIACATTDLGVVISNFGEAPETPYDPDVPDEFYPNIDNYNYTSVVDGELEYGENSRLPMFTKKIDQLRSFSHQFIDFRVFDVYVPAFRASWAFAIGIVPRFSNADGKLAKQGVAFYDGTPVQVNYKLRNGLIKPSDVNSELYDPLELLEHFDGTAHQRHKYSYADWEGVYCEAPSHDRVCTVSQRFFDDESSLWKVTNTDGQKNVVALTDLAKDAILGAWDEVFPGAEKISETMGTSCDPNTAFLLQAEPWLADSDWNPALADMRSQLASSMVLLRNVKKGESLTYKGKDC